MKALFYFSSPLVPKFGIRDRIFAKIRMGSLGVVFCACSLNVTTVAAEEGFFLTPPSTALTQVWNNTVAVVLPNGVGSGVLIHTEKISNRRFVYFLTAGHLRMSTDWPDNEPVAASSKFEPITIYQDMILTLGTSSDLKVVPLPNNPKFVWGILKFSDGDDVGLLVYEVDAESSDITPSALSSDLNSLKPGRRIYIMGFPNPQERPTEDQKVAIASPNLITKRWSTGLIVKTQPRGFTLTTADCLHGDSGGPVVDEAGNPLGIFNNGAFLPPGTPHSSAYRGREKGLTPDSAFYPFPHLQRFLNANIENFRKYIEQSK